MKPGGESDKHARIAMDCTTKQLQLAIVLATALVAGCTNPGDYSGSPQTTESSSDADTTTTDSTGRDTTGDPTADTSDPAEPDTDQTSDATGENSHDSRDTTVSDSSDATSPDADDAAGCSPDAMTTWYPDNDGDNYGDADAGSSTTCRVPDSGAATQPGDCNDSNKNINPSRKERCDGIDNDCDENVDEGLTPKPCAKQRGVCSGTTVGCLQGAFPTCTKREYGSNYEVRERSCDGLDNDCDGRVDEGNVCCSKEVCDGKDNDCDGAIDENLQRSCGSNTGVCRRGTQVCVTGSWSRCRGGIRKQPERCWDGVDNDCDGSTDCRDHVDCQNAPNCRP